MTEAQGVTEPADERATRREGWRLMRRSVRPYLRIVILGIGAGLL